MSGVTHKLVAISGLARRFHTSSGTDLILKDSTKLGRSVQGHEGYRFPVEWGQISGHHCRIFKDNATDPPTWYVEDSSTNGTFVNDVRVPKFERLPLHEGDTLRLSIPPNEVMVYMFQKHVECEPAGLDSSCQTNAMKRKALVQGVEVVSQSEEQKKRAKLIVQLPDSDSQADLLKQLSNLERTNAALRQRLEAKNVEIHQLQQQMLAEKACQYATITTLEGKLEEEQKKNRESKEALSEAANLELAATKRRVQEAEMKMQELMAMLDAETEAKQKAEKSSIALQATMLELKAAVSSVEEENAGLISTKEVLQKKVEELEGEIQLLEQKLEEETGERQKAQEEITRVTQQLEAEQKSAEATKRVAQAAEKELHMVQKELEVEKKLRRTATDDLQEHQARAADLKRRLECVEEKLVGKVDKMLVQKAHFKAIHTAHCHAQELQSTLQRMMEAINQQLLDALSETDDVLTQAEALPQSGGEGGGARDKLEQPGNVMETQMAPATLQMADGDFTQPQDMAVDHAPPASSSAPPSKPAPRSLQYGATSHGAHLPPAPFATQLADGSFPMPATLAVSALYQATLPLTAHPASLPGTDPTATAQTTQPQPSSLPLSAPACKTTTPLNLNSTSGAATSHLPSAGPAHPSIRPPTNALPSLTNPAAEVPHTLPSASHVGRPVACTAAVSNPGSTTPTPHNPLISPIVSRPAHPTTAPTTPGVPTPHVAHPTAPNTTPALPASQERCASVNSSQAVTGQGRVSVNGTPGPSGLASAMAGASEDQVLKAGSPSEDRTTMAEEGEAEADGGSSAGVKVDRTVTVMNGVHRSGTSQGGGAGLSPSGSGRVDGVVERPQTSSEWMRERPWNPVDGELAEEDVTDDDGGSSHRRNMGNDVSRQVGKAGNGLGVGDGEESLEKERGAGYDPVGVGSGGLGFMEGQPSEGFGFGQGQGGGMTAAGFKLRLDCLVSTEEN